MVKVDRKVSIEFLNDVQFLLENHVLQADQASTPLKQLYFVTQVILMSPGNAGEALGMFRRSLPLLLASFQDPRILAGLKNVDRLVGEGHVYDALKAIRALYPLETGILATGRQPARTEAAHEPLAEGAA